MSVFVKLRTFYYFLLIQHLQKRGAYVLFFLSKKARREGQNKGGLFWMLLTWKGSLRSEWHITASLGISLISSSLNEVMLIVIQPIAHAFGAAKCWWVAEKNKPDTPSMLWLHIVYSSPWKTPYKWALVRQWIYWSLCTLQNFRNSSN